MRSEHYLDADPSFVPVAVIVENTHRQDKRHTPDRGNHIARVRAARETEIPPRNRIALRFERGSGESPVPFDLLTLSRPIAFRNLHCQAIVRTLAPKSIRNVSPEFSVMLDP